MVNRNRNLENRLGKNNWAYTGSIALKIHANRLGVPINRRIGNINIAAKDPLIFVPVIGSTKHWKLKNSPNYRRTKFYNNRGVTLDLFPANGRLAPNFKHVQKFNTLPPIMSLRSLLNQKVKTRENAVNRNLPKINTNIRLLKIMLNKNKNSPQNPIRRNNNNNRGRRSTGGRKLIF